MKVQKNIFQNVNNMINLPPPGGGAFPAHVTGQTEIISFDAVPKQLDSHFRVREGIIKTGDCFYCFLWVLKGSFKS